MWPTMEILFIIICLLIPAGKKSAEAGANLLINLTNDACGGS